MTGITQVPASYPCPSCNGTGKVREWQHEDPEVGEVGMVEYDCDFCAGSTIVTATDYHFFKGTLADMKVTPVEPASNLNPEILRLIRQEGAELRISGHRSGFSAGLNTNCGSASAWLASTAYLPTIHEALVALLTDQSIQPEDDRRGEEMNFEAEAAEMAAPLVVESANLYDDALGLEPDGMPDEDEESSRSIILHLIDVERARQDRKWGEQNHDPAIWYAILGEEFGEVGKEVCERAGKLARGLNIAAEGHADKMRDELIQLAAVAVAMLESLERNQGVEL